MSEKPWRPELPLPKPPNALVQQLQPDGTWRTLKVHVPEMTDDEWRAWIERRAAD